MFHAHRQSIYARVQFKKWQLLEDNIINFIFKKNSQLLKTTKFGFKKELNPKQNLIIKL